MNESNSFDETTSVTSEMMLSATNSTPSMELDVGFTTVANERHLVNVTDEMIWSSDCGTITMDYGIIACVICGIAFVIGVIFCVFGK